MAKYGREPDELKIMPAFCPVLGRTRAKAQAKFDQLQELVDPLAGLGSLYSTFGTYAQSRGGGRCERMKISFIEV